MSAQAAAALDWFGEMIRVAASLSPAEREDLAAWEAEHVNGSGCCGTSDWPGWAEHLIPFAEYVATTDPRRGRRQRRKNLPYRAVWDRDDWTCQSCGTHRQLTVDHIVPLAAGGSDDLANLQTLCLPCNIKKGARI